MAWMEISSSVQSMLASWTRSLMASMICLRIFPWVRRASNMVAVWLGWVDEEEMEEDCKNEK